jgi:HEAT repeat protein
MPVMSACLSGPIPMLKSLRLSAGLLVVLLLAASPAVGADDPDELALKSAGIAVDSPALIDFLRQRCRVAATAEELQKLLVDLTSRETRVQDAATAELIKRGPLAIPALRKAVNDLDEKDLSLRAAKCLNSIVGRGGADLAASVVRLLGNRKHDAAMDELLNFLSFADDPIVTEATAQAVAQLAYPNDVAHPALRKALGSPVPVVRATAAEALARVEHPETRPAIVVLLRDPSLPVRTRSALALAKIEEVAAIPTLIDLVGELPKANRVPVEDLLKQLAGETMPKNLPTGDDEPARKGLRDAWSGWWQKVDGAPLLEEFRSRTLKPGEQAIVDDLVRKLADKQYRVREKSMLDLANMGAKALAALRVAVKDVDAERAKRAEDCVGRINRSEGKRVPAGTARLAALRKPPGAIEAMLGYLPYLDDDEGMLNEIRNALVALSIDANGRADGALVQSLNDPEPVRRSVAAESLTKGAKTQSRESVRKLLKDANLSVRQSVAAALTIAGDKDAVPVLIELLSELPPDQSWTAQDLLNQIAGDQAPGQLVGDKPEDRRKYRDTWAAWWKAKGDGIDLAKLTSSPGYLGYTLLIEVSNNNSVGRVAEVGRDGKIRWQIGNLKYPVDAFILPGERVLITEWDGNRVAEWDFKGNTIWKKEGFNGRATNAQRLPNGNTFICTTSEVLEVDRAGKNVMQFNVPAGLTAAYKSPSGEIVALRNDGQVARYDVKGKEIKTFPSNRDTSWTSGIDIARNGNILVSQPSPNQKVTEYTPEGKVVREWKADGVTTATKLNNGNILVASHNNRNVVEYDAANKKVWDYTDEFHIFRAKRR